MSTVEERAWKQPVQNRCAVCNDPASTRLLITDGVQDLNIWVCQEHGFEVTQVKVFNA